MAAAKPITIVGGGLAGLTLGIGLRQHAVPVTVIEAGEYPRHRVCGEFISGRGQDSLARLGLLQLIQQAGAVKAQTAAFGSTARINAPRRLPTSAICISRFVLDAILATELCRLGGELITGTRRQSGEYKEGTVRATGRLLNLQSDQNRWFGLKVHARNVPLAADLEMHIFSSGYVGLCKINESEVNICGLFRRRTNERSGGGNPRDWLRGQPGSPLRERLNAAEFDEDSFCAVAGLSLRPRRAIAAGEISVGDAITMIPPVTGNGMSMAFESAELALAPLVAWSRGELGWENARRKIATACDAGFKRRLAWAHWLQRLLLNPTLQKPLVSLANRSDWFWRLAFERTR